MPPERARRPTRRPSAECVRRRRTDLRIVGASHPPIKGELEFLIGGVTDLERLPGALFKHVRPGNSEIRVIAHDAGGHTGDRFHRALEAPVVLAISERQVWNLARSGKPAIARFGQLPRLRAAEIVRLVAPGATKAAVKANKYTGVKP